MYTSVTMYTLDRQLSKYPNTKTVTLLVLVVFTAMQSRQYKEHSSADEKAETEDDETESVDDCSSSNPFTHHLLIFVALMTQLSVTTYSCLQLVVN